MTRFFSILFLLAIGIAGLPFSASACDAPVSKEMACCQKKNDQPAAAWGSLAHIIAHSETAGTGCEGECNHSSCLCAPTSVSPALPVSGHLSFDDTGHAGQKNASLNPLNISVGYVDIWRPPKLM